MMGFIESIVLGPKFFETRIGIGICYSQLA
jgi:hypothetical protein